LNFQSAVTPKENIPAYGRAALEPSASSDSGMQREATYHAGALLRESRREPCTSADPPLD